MLSLSVALAFSSPSSAELYRRLERQGGRVLYVAAHPDDENTRLLAWLVHAEGGRAAYLSLTRGEGGQNLIGPEQAPLLGVIRTQELLAARRIDGAEQFFGGQADFGYSKSPEEALRVWGHDKALADVVQVIRTFKPDVIVTRFSPKPQETHGHHTASAILALEAFSKAADPAYRGPIGCGDVSHPGPHSLAHLRCDPGLPPWQATRVVWNRYFWDGPKPGETDGLLKVDVGGFDAVLGQSYTEIAARSRSMHKSQGFGASPQRGSVDEYFEHLAGTKARTSLFDDVKRDRPAKVPFKIDDPAASAAYLSDAEDVAAFTGLFVEASVPDRLQVEGVQTTLTFTMQNRCRLPMTLQSASVLGSVFARDKVLDKVLRVEHPFVWRTGAVLSITFSVNGKSHTLTRPIEHVWTDRVHGERHAPVTTAPAVTVNPLETVLIVTDDQPRTLNVRVRATAKAEQGVLSLGAFKQPYKLDRAGAEQVVTFTLQPKQSETLRFEPGVSLTRIDYPHIPPQDVLAPSEVRISRFDLKKGGSRIGYVMGAGDAVPQALRQVGYEVTLLSLDDLEGDLSRFDAIMLGVRAYNTHPRLLALNPRLFAYAQNGGVVLAQYNTIVKEDIGPYPLTLSRDRVTDETAPMRMLAHPLWSRPNTITPADFNGWVQERGLYFASSFDARYSPLLETNDPNERSSRGGLLVAPLGKGRFIYTGLAFFRQLPAGVPGAFRLLANLLAR